LSFVLNYDITLNVRKNAKKNQNELNVCSDGHFQGHLPQKAGGQQG
jgi:hypothetical protein